MASVIPVSGQAFCVIVNCTGTVNGLPAAPGDKTVTVPVCTPAASPAGSSVTDRVDGVMPARVPREIHGCSAVATHASAPPPRLLMLRSTFFLPSFCCAVGVMVDDATECPSCVLLN